MKFKNKIFFYKQNCRVLCYPGCEGAWKVEISSLRYCTDFCSFYIGIFFTQMTCVIWPLMPKTSHPNMRLNWPSTSVTWRWQLISSISRWKGGNISKYVVFFKLFRIMLGKTVRSFITPTSMMNLSPWIPSCVNNRYSWCSNYFHLNSSQISVPLHQPPYQCEGWFLDIFNTLSWEKHWLIT